MKNTTIYFLSFILLTGSFIFAQSDDCDQREVVDSYSFNTRQYKDLDVSISYGLGDLTIAGTSE